MMVFHLLFSKVLSPLTHIFNICLKKGHFPSVWKSGNIFPLYKSGSRNLIENYTRIVKFSHYTTVALSKLFKSLVTKRHTLTAGASL